MARCPSQLPQRGPDSPAQSSHTPDAPSHRLHHPSSPSSEPSPEDVPLDTPTDTSAPTQQTNTRVYVNRNGTFSENAYSPERSSPWPIASPLIAQASSSQPSRKRQTLDDSRQLENEIRKQLKFDSPAHDKRDDEPPTPKRAGRRSTILGSLDDVFGGTSGENWAEKTPDDRETTPPPTLHAALSSSTPVSVADKGPPPSPRSIRFLFSADGDRAAPVLSLRLTEAIGAPSIVITSPPSSPPSEDSVSSSPTHSTTSDSDTVDLLCASLLESPLLDDRLCRAPSTRSPVETAHEQGKVSAEPFKRGVTVRCDEAVRKGDTILKCDPLHSVLHSLLLETHCSGCFMVAEHKARETGKSLAYWNQRYHPCSQCKAVVFCSAKCYAKTAHAHHQECRYLRSGQGVPSAQVRLLARICHSAAENQGVDFLPYFDVHRISSQEIHKIFDVVRQVQHILSYTRQPNLDKYNLRQKATLVNLTRRARATIFTMHDWKATPVGLCISPQLAHFNHSGRPTAIVAFPFGTAVDQPLRVLAIDPLYAGQELTISYIDPGVPLNKRTQALAPYGIGHNCDWCEREPIDYRWAIHHLGCDRRGFVPLAVPDQHGQLRTSQCSGCAKRLWADVDETPYKTMMEALDRSWQAECEGLWKLYDHDPQIEFAAIQSKVRESLNVLPDTVYPIPHLYRRMARLMLSFPASNSETLNMETLNQACEYLNTAHDAIIEWNNNEPRPITLSLLIDELSAHVEIIKILFYAAKGMESSGGKVGPDGQKFRGTEYKDTAQQYLRRLQEHVKQGREVVNTARDEAMGMSGDGGYMLDEVEEYDRKLLNISRKVGL